MHVSPGHVLRSFCCIQQSAPGAIRRTHHRNRPSHRADTKQEVQAVHVKFNVLSAGVVAALAVALPASAAQASPGRAPGASSPAAQGVTPGGARATATPQRLASYWTAARLRAAKPVVAPKAENLPKASAKPNGPATSVAGAAAKVAARAADAVKP